MKTEKVELSVVARMTEEFLEELRGTDVDGADDLINQYVDRYPQHEAEICGFFPALKELEQFSRATADEDATGEKGFPVFADYVIIREIGRGGMGIVYEAKQKSLGRRVALKTLGRSTLHPTLLERFRREAKTAAGLHHTNIVPVYEVGLENDIHFFSMQYIDGFSLAELCTHLRESRSHVKLGSTRRVANPGTQLETRSHDMDQGSPHLEDQSKNSAFDLTLSQTFDYSTRATPAYQRRIAELGAQIADALDHIHQHGIVHRDIKPSNLLVDRSNNAWLADWGLVKSEASDLTQTGDVFGSLPYMAPERFRGQSDSTSDIYSLGVTLYELLTLHPLFESDDGIDLIKRITDEDPALPSELEPAISRDLETVILKAIDKRPQARYKKASLLADDLRNVVAGRPVMARRLTTGERLWRLCQANPLVAALTLVVALLLIAGITTTTILAVSANRARLQAEHGKRKSDDTLKLLIENIFAQADPDKLNDPDISLREVIDRAVERVRESTDYDPEVRVTALMEFGKIYFNRQDYGKSRDLFQEAVEISTMELGERAPLAMSALDQLGMVYIRLGQYELAVEILNKAWKLQSEELGPEHENTVHSRAKIGDAYGFMGKFEEAIAVTNEVWEIRKRRWGPEYRYSLVSMNGLGLAYIQIDRLDKAAEMFEYCLTTAQKYDYGMDHVYHMHNLARTCQLQGKLEKAKQLVDECLRIRIEMLGRASHSTLSSRNLQAAILRDMNKKGEALDLFESVWADASQTNLDRIKGEVLLEWGLCLQDLDRSEQAMQKLSQAQVLLERSLGKRNRYTRAARLALDEILAADAATDDNSF